jgi:hypothetical protein
LARSKAIRDSASAAPIAVQDSLSACFSFCNRASVREADLDQRRFRLDFLSSQR